MKFDLISRAYAATAKNFSKIPTDGSFEYNVVLKTVLEVVLGVASALAILALIVGAAQYVGSMGDPTKAEGAKKTITWAIAGIILLMLFYAIIVYVLPTVVPGEVVPGASSPS